MNKLNEGVAGQQIVKYFRENGGKEAIDAQSIGSPDFLYYVYRITFEGGEVADYRWKWSNTKGLGFEVESVERIGAGALADDDGELITIQAKANVTDGHVTSVRLTGVSALLGETIHDIAQEAVNATYGQHKANHRRVVVFTDQEWVDMRETEPESITVRVHTY